MTTTLTTTDLAMLETMEAQAQAGQISFWEIYEWLGDLLEAKDVPLTDSSLLWVRGATEANADRGSFSDLIRAATETQHQLRYGTNTPEGKMQEASNQVAQNLINDLMGRNSDWPKGDVPDISRIAEADARAIGRVLFGPENGKSEKDTAFTQNAAWPGTLLFSMLRNDQAGRLISTGSNASIDILDNDGQGSIEVDGTVLSGGRLKQDKLWVSEDGAWRYVRLSNDDLLITPGNRDSDTAMAANIGRWMQVA